MGLGPSSHVICQMTSVAFCQLRLSLEDGLLHWPGQAAEQGVAVCHRGQALKASSHLATGERRIVRHCPEPGPQASRKQRSPDLVRRSMWHLHMPLGAPPIVQPPNDLYADDSVCCQNTSLCWATLLGDVSEGVWMWTNGLGNLDTLLTLCPAYQTQGA